MKILLATPIDPHNNAHWQKLRREELANLGRSASSLPREQRQYYLWKALRQLGHEVLVHVYTEPTKFSTPLAWVMRLESAIQLPGSTRLRTRLKKSHIREIQKRLIAEATDFAPNLVMFTDAWDIYDPEFVIDLKSNTSASVILLNGTSPVVMVGDKLRKTAPYFDCIVCNDFFHSIQWLELGAKQAIALPYSACDPEDHRPYDLTPSERKELRSDVCFVGTLAPDHLYADRIRFLEALIEFDLGIWTRDQNALANYPFLQRFYRGVAYGTKMAKVLSASRIAINIHGCSMQRGGNMRTFEIPATGTLQLVDRYDPAWFEEGKEIVSFDTPQDLREKVRYFLEHDEERKTIAMAGQRRAYRDHTYKQRMSRLLEILALGAGQ